MQYNKQLNVCSTLYGLELFANSAFYTLESFYIHHFAGALK